MTALGIRYLRGYAVAEDRAKERAEWPPHPGRVFMALAAAHFETGEDPAERCALEWLEQQGAPKIAASDIQPRTRAEAFVPVNDTPAGILNRSRQPRTFATMRLDRDSVFLIWDAQNPELYTPALHQLCRKVTRIGHSSSLVQMWVASEDQIEAPTWNPDNTSPENRLRIAPGGTLSSLEQTFGRDQFETYERLATELGSAKGKQKSQIKAHLAATFPDGPPKQTRPRLSAWQGYSRATSANVAQQRDHSPFDPRLLIFTKFEGPALGLEGTLALTGALRDAAMKAAGANVPEWLSGHQPDGTVSQKPHAAFFPLPFVGADYADGHILGMALAIPREVPEPDRRQALSRLLFREDGAETEIHLWRKQSPWELSLQRETRTNPPIALRPTAWTAPSKTWASVTPVVLHHFPKKNRDEDIERILLEAFDSALLPRPVTLRIQPASHFTGAPGARPMPPFTEGGENLCRYQVHIVATFEHELEGPVLVGRGRFRGYGLLRPSRANKEEGA